MPLCKKYDELSHADKVIFLGQICHAAQSNDEIFSFAQTLILLATIKGIFDGVTINPCFAREEDGADL